MLGGVEGAAGSSRLIWVGQVPAELLADGDFLLLAFTQPFPRGAKLDRQTHPELGSYKILLEEPNRQYSSRCPRGPQ